MMLWACPLVELADDDDFEDDITIRLRLFQHFYSSDDEEIEEDDD